MVNYCVIDLETNGTTTYKRFCNPLDRNHNIQLVAVKPKDGEGMIYRPYIWSEGFSQRQIKHPLGECELLVGQNFKFDLLWVWGNLRVHKYLESGGKVYDTQTAQYLIDGQNDEPRHLDTMAIKYGGVVKDDRLKTMYSAGMQSKDINSTILIPYAIKDVENTELVFKGQLCGERFPNQLIEAYMEHYLAITDIEYNGMFIEREFLEELGAKLITDIEDICQTLINMSDNTIDNPNSPTQVSKHIYGTRVSVNKKALTDALRQDQEHPHKLFIETLLKLREKVKLQTTYVGSVTYYKQPNENKGIKRGDVKTASGLLSLIHPDGMVHSSYATAQTHTARLASSAPNLQNCPKTILQAFRSRYGAGGVIMEADYSQLECCIAAQLSQDQVLIQEIINGIDLHRENAARLYNIPKEEVTDAQRSLAKQMTFSLFYGAHFKRMAADKGIPEETAEMFINQFYDKYVGVKEWHDRLAEEVKKNSHLTEEELILKGKIPSGEMRCASYIDMPHGKRYVFKDLGVLTKVGTVYRYWPMTDIKNYPVQGTAADVMALMVGRLWRNLFSLRDECLLINEVHDSVVLDVRIESVDKIAALVKKELTDITAAWKKQYNLTWNVPLSVDIKWGETWLHCKKDWKDYIKQV